MVRKRQYTEHDKKQRMRALVRDNFCCQADKLGLCKDPCGEHPIKDLEVHHKKFWINGGSSTLENLTTLCLKHHDQIHPWRKKSVTDSRKRVPDTRKEL